MSEFKGIKWNYNINANKGYDVSLEGSVHTIANVLSKDVSYMPNIKEAEANAKLIACAPEMLFNNKQEIKILKKVLKQLDELGGYLITDLEDLIESKEQLIKKATS